MRKDDLYERRAGFHLNPVLLVLCEVLYYMDGVKLASYRVSLN